MRATPSSPSVDYRGITAPQARSTSPTTLLTPRQQRPVIATPPADQSYGAAKVLQQKLHKWSLIESDLTAHLQGATPPTAFAGITEQRSQWDKADPRSNVTVTPGGLIYFLGKERLHGGFFWNTVTSAKIDSAGQLSFISYAGVDGNNKYAPLPIGEGVIVVGGGASAEWIEVSPGGKLAAKPFGWGHACDSGSTLLSPGVILKSFLGRIQAYRPSGSPQVIAEQSQTPQIDGASAPVLHDDMVVLMNHDVVQTMRRVDTMFVTLDRFTHAHLFSGHMYPPFVTKSGVIVQGSSGGELAACAMDASGKLRSLPGHFTVRTKSATPCPVVFGNTVITSDGQGNVRTYRIENDTLVEGVSFPTGGEISARPTVTRDGVVLIGTTQGDLFALQLGPDGSLKERERKHLSEPISHAVSVTPEGFVLVPGDTSIFVLGGPAK